MAMFHYFKRDSPASVAVPDLANPGIARVKFWSVVVVADHYIHVVLWNTTRVACPGNLAALKPPVPSIPCQGPFTIKKRSSLSE